MSDESFQIKFPSLQGLAEFSLGCDISCTCDICTFPEGIFFKVQDIEKFCLDKEKVREIIKRICTGEWENCGNRLIGELGLEEI